MPKKKYGWDISGVVWPDIRFKLGRNIELAFGKAGATGLDWRGKCFYSYETSFGSRTMARKFENGLILTISETTQ
jgi:hypothetical protein